MVAGNVSGAVSVAGKASCRSDTKPSLSPRSSSRTASRKMLAVNSGQISRRRSPRLLGNIEEIEKMDISSGDLDKIPTKKKLSSVNSAGANIDGPVNAEDSSRSHSKSPLSPSSPPPSSRKASHTTSAENSGQVSRRRSPRLLDNIGETDEFNISSVDLDKIPAKKKVSSVDNVATNVDGEGCSHPPPSSRKARDKTPATHSGQKSRRRSPRFLDNDYQREIDHLHISSVDLNKVQARKLNSANNVAADITIAGEGSSHPHTKDPLSPSSEKASDKTSAVNYGQNSRKRSRRFLGNDNPGESDDFRISSLNLKEIPAKKKLRTTSGSRSSMPCYNNLYFFVGDPVPDEEARRKWPWRYEHKGSKKEGRNLETNNNNDDDEDDKLVLNVKCHYSQAKIEDTVFDLGDCAYVKGEEGGHDYVGRILEFFKTMDDKDFFRIQWFFRAEDTVINVEGASHDDKRLFYSTLMNDNALDCIVSKVEVVKVAAGVNLKSIPACDFYYDMTYDVDYSTFCTIKNDISSDGCCSSSFPNKKADHAKGGKTNLNAKITKLKPHKSEMTLLDVYSGCGGMSTGLCFGAKLSGINLLTKWAVDSDKSACESLKLNHPETQIRNGSSEDFLDLIKEWDKLCKKYSVRKKKTQGRDYRSNRSDDNDMHSETGISDDEYEVASLVDVCYGNLDGTSKRGLKFKVRWAGYGPDDDTWELIEDLRKCDDKIREFILKGLEENILPRPGDVDIVCGGPPCQGISGFNHHRNFESPLDDERNYQIVVFMEIIKFLRPKYILMENVADILRFADGFLSRYAISCLVRNNYQTRLGIMAAGCYGLPQFRLRIFLWGAHPDEQLPRFPLPSHDVVLRYGAPTGFERNVVAYDEGQHRDLEKALCLRDAISDLPPVMNSEIRDTMTYEGPPKTAFQNYIRATKSDMLGVSSGPSTKVEKSLLYDHRPLQINDTDYLRVCRIAKRKGANFRDLPGIVVGADNVVRRTVNPELMPSGKHWVPDYAINLRQGKSRRPFARLWWDQTVSTVLCEPKYRSEAILHPQQDRVLTIRECARLQGFPDYYALRGTVKDRYRQVGNAVAVPVARALGYTLGMAMQNLSGDEPLVTLPPKFSHSTTFELLKS